MVRRMVRHLAKCCSVSALLLAGALAAAPAASQAQDLRLEAELEPAQVLVQAQAVYRLRFYQAVDVRELKINGPSAQLAEVRAIGGERVYEAMRDGRRYRVHERSYAVFPFGSGALVLTGASATGRIAATPATQSADGRQAVRLEAAAQTLTVNPVPAAAGTAAWLPARTLSLTESWSAPATELRPGQALWRSIRIEAAGMDAAQIPPLRLLSPLSMAVPGMLVDAEPPRLENRMAGDLNVGVRVQTLRMVALRAGAVRVPELQLRWWNLNTDTAASATLPARSWQVQAADSAPASVLSTPAVSAAAPDHGQAQAQPTPASTSKPWLALLAAAALLCAGLALACAWRPRVRAAWRLQRACRNANAAAVRDGLLQWAASVWPQAPPMTLQALAERSPDPAARQALTLIERSLYGPAPGRCDAAALGDAVRAVKRASRHRLSWRRHASPQRTLAGRNCPCTASSLFPSN
jgi:hypothetical protein